MKNLTKIFMAVVAGMFAFSCVTDTTNDLAPEVNVNGGEGQHALTLSLEKSRTLLGEKGTDGVYPVSWCEDDAIAVNGVASTGIEIKADGKTATFTFGDSGISRPFNVVYPAPAAEVDASATTGLYPITLLAEQPYTEGSFCDGAAVMYGYATADDAFINMHHLTGVLRVAPYGEGVVLKRITFKAQLGKIAGTFDVNCVTGELSPRAEASNTITVDLGDNFALAATAEEATPIYAAVPAGEYGMFTVVFETENDSMTLKFDSNGEKAIKASVVREFGAFPYLANEGGNDEFLIESKEDLFEFAQIAANFAPYTSAKLAATIDMTGEEWTPIEGFAHSFDGNSGAGYSIVGLNAPLFGETSGTIFDLELEDVNIVSNGRLVLGAVACKLVAGEAQSLIQNCHVTGSITVDNPNASFVSGGGAYYTVNCGGIAGYIAGGAVNYCVNEANITVTQVLTSSNTEAIHPAVGGIVGAASVTGEILSPITHCVNGNEDGTTGTIQYHDNCATTLYIPHIGGIVGLSSASNVSSLAHCTNYGDLDINAKAGGSGTISFDSTCIGGIFGYSRGEVDNNNNYGTITVSGGKYQALYLGGVGGVVVPVSFSNNHNQQGANISVDSDVTFHSMSVAGVLSARNGGDGIIDTCTNDAPIEVKASSAEDVVENANYYYRVAGVVTYTNDSVANCENKANGDINVSGNIVIARKNNQSGFAIVGVSAYHTTSGTMTNLINRGDINITANVAPLATWTTTTDHQTYGKIDIAGICGYNTRSKRDLQNYGHITIGSTTTATSISGNGIHIGGLVSHGSGGLGVTNLTELVNQGNITINKVTLKGNFTPTVGETVNPWEVRIGGISSSPTSGAITSAKNTGNIWLNTGSQVTSNVSIGGIAGTTGSAALTSVTNNGNITIDGECKAYLYWGGNVGRYEGSAMTNCSNSGDLTLNKHSTHSQYIWFGGIAGQTTEAVTLTNCHNTGVLTFAETVTGCFESYIGGLLGGGGYAKASGISKAVVTLDNCTNGLKENSTSEYGLVINNRQSKNASNSNRQRIGAIAGAINTMSVTTSIANSADIMVRAHYLDSGGLSIAGSVGVMSGLGTLTGSITNTGDIYYAGKTNNCNCAIAGLFASPAGSITAATLISACDIRIIKSEGITDHIPLTSTGKRAVVGGVVGFACTALENARYFGDIYVVDWHAGAYTTGNNFSLIGAEDSGFISNCHCGGNIYNEYNADRKVYDTDIEINETTYFQYINGVTPMDAATAKSKGCGYISSIDATPIDSEGNPITPYVAPTSAE